MWFTYNSVFQKKTLVLLSVFFPLLQFDCIIFLKNFLSHFAFLLMFCEFMLLFFSIKVADLLVPVYDCYLLITVVLITGTYLIVMKEKQTHTRW